MDMILEQIQNCRLLVADGGPICGVILGGSAAYRQGEYKSIEELQDIDYLFITPKKENFIILFNEKIEDLKKSVGIEKCECSIDLFKKALTPTFWEEFDSIRFSGYSNIGQKITIKLIDAEFIKSSIYNQNGHVRLLSFKRKSTIHAILDEGLNIVTIASLDNRLVIDGEIINVLSQFLLRKSKNNKLIMGVFADLILSGHKLYEFNETIENIRSDLIYNIRNIQCEPNFLQFLLRINIMPDTYIQELMQKYSEKRPNIIKKLPDRIKWQIEFLPNNVKNGELQLLPKDIFEPTKIQLENFDLVLEYVNVSLEDFPTTHKFGKAFIESNKYFFFKETLNYKWELYGFREGQKYFSNIQQIVSCCEDRNICIYQWVNGDSLGTLRIKYFIKSCQITKIFGVLHPCQYENKSDLQLFFEFITNIELFRAEEMLNVYRNSKTLKNTSGIHNVFLKRFEENRFFNNYKKDTFNIRSQVKIDDISELPLIVNGKKFENLSYYIKMAEHFLSFTEFENDLKNLNLTNSFGFGDTHCGKIMLFKDLIKDKFIYIDYECAGYHSPFLDLCKGFAIDVFFNIYQLDVLLNLSKKFENPYNVKVDVKKCDENLIGLYIDHDFTLDWISFIAFRAKYTGVFEALLFELDEEEKIHRAWDIFRSGIFCSLLFAKKFPIQQQLFLMIAVAVELFEADYRNLNDTLKPMTPEVNSQS